MTLAATQTTQQTTPPILYVLIDGDDTIWPTDEPLPQGYHRNLDTLSQFIGFGNEGSWPFFAYCSGREVNYFVGAARSLEASNCLSILENGNFFYNVATRERYNHPLLTKERVKEVEAAFLEIRTREPQMRDEFPEFEPYLRKEVNIALERRSPEIEVAYYVEPVQKMLSDFDSFIDVTSSQHAIDIVVKGVNKKTATLELCRRMNISPKQVLSIGDSENDSMMEVTGYVGCPRNASDKCKRLVRAKGGHESEYTYVIGVVDVIETYLTRTN